MKKIILFDFVLLLVAVVTARGQGFIYDQQSATGDVAGEGGATIQTSQPLGQSFTPSLSTVGFIRLNPGDNNVGNGLGATMYVNLLSGSITGTIIGSTTPVFMPDGFGVGAGNEGFVNFVFTIPVSVTSGTTYYFQPVVESGDSWSIGGSSHSYGGGTAYVNGIASPNNDFWFREGIVPAPEPSIWSLMLIGGGVLLFFCRFHRRWVLQL